MLLGNAHVEEALGMVRPEEVQSRAAGHCGGDGHNALVLVRQAHQRVGEDLGIGGLADWLGLARLRIKGTKAVKLLLQVERRLEAAALLRQHVQQHRVVGLRLEKLEGLHQQRQVVAVDGTIVLQPELLEEDGRPEQALGGLFGAARHLRRRLATHPLDHAMG